MTKENLLKKLQAEVLKTPEIIAAFNAIDRADFVSEDYRALAYADTALPIGFEATISQPYTVAFMLELLSPKAGDLVLDVGSGSGWSSALLAKIVGQKGRVIGTEIVPELVGFGKKNSAKYRLKNLEFIKAGGQKGLAEKGPYDRILVSAAAEMLPDELIGQLKPGGRLVVPVQSSIWKVEKNADGKVEEKEFPGFEFVPLQ